MKTLFSHCENWEVGVITSLASVLSAGPGYSKLPQPGPEIPSHLNDSYSQSLYRAVCESRLDSEALKHVQVAYLKNPSAWKKWQVPWVEFQCNYTSYAPATGLHQELPSPPVILGLYTLGINHLALNSLVWSRLTKYWVFILFSFWITASIDACLLGPAQSSRAEITDVCKSPDRGSKAKLGLLQEQQVFLITE